MNKILIFLTIVVVIAGGTAVYFWQRENAARMQQAADEAAVRNTVEGFGKVLKNVSPLSPTASQDIENNYKPFLAPALLAEWENDPSKAVGRLTSSPWPDRIEVSSIKQFGSGAYDVTGSIIEVTSVEEVQGGAAAKQTIELSVVKFGDQWLINSVMLGAYAYNF
jgi:hypothetical protein